MKILDFIICDDIRREIGNKHSIIGAYNDMVAFQAKSESDIPLPLVMRFGFFLRLDLEGEKHKIKHIEFTFTGTNVNPAKGSFVVQETLDPARPLVLVASNLDLVINGFGDVDIQLNVVNNDEKVLASLSPSFKFKIAFQQI